MLATESPFEQGAANRSEGFGPVYITGTAAFLPGEPVGCEQMEDFIGRMPAGCSAFGRRALRWNGIQRRHYALDTDGRWLHSNASMCADAVRGAKAYISAAIMAADRLQVGSGRGPVHHFHEWW